MASHRTPRIFSGIQQSGGLTLGNYLGALKRFADGQGQVETVFCLVDLHAITVWQDPAALGRQTRELAAGTLRRLNKLEVDGPYGYWFASLTPDSEKRACVRLFSEWLDEQIEIDNA